MTRFLEIQHDEWVDAAPEAVRAHYGDLQHRLAARVHPRERLRIGAPGPTGPRYERLLRSGWRVQRDLVERQYRPDGSVVDTVVAGPNWGRSLRVRFWRREGEHGPGTLVEYTLTQPLPPLIGRLLARWTRRRLERELREGAAEDRADVERIVPSGRSLRVA